MNDCDSFMLLVRILGTSGHCMKNVRVNVWFVFTTDIDVHMCLYRVSLGVRV